MAQTQRVSKNNTQVYSAHGELVCKLHNTKIVRKVGLVIRLNSGGWKTVTTKTRMNQFANQYCGAAFSVYQQKGEWFVYIRKDDTFIEFSDGMEFTL